MSAETGIAPTEQQRPEYLHFSPDHISGLQARLALGGDALDPTKSFDRQITPDMVVELKDRDLAKVVTAITMQGASKEGAPTHTDWAVSYGKVLDSKHNKTHVAKVAQIIGKSGIAFAGDNGASVAEAVHKRYFQTGKSIEMKKGTETKAYQAIDLTQVVEDILAGYTTESKIDYDKLKGDRKEIMWFLKIFPKGSDEIIWALVDEEAKRRANPNVFYADINAEVQVTQGSTRKTVRRFEPNALTAYEKKMLHMIWHGKEVPPATQNSTEHLPDPSKQPLFEKDKQYDSIELFRSIPHPVSKKNPYIINRVPDALNLTPDDRQALVTAEPFFVNIRLRNGQSLYRDVNPNVAPYAYKLENDLKDNRYNAAEIATHRDSGLFALCAASARSPEEQNKLFLLVADEIITSHMLNPDLLNHWMKGQFSDQGGGMYSQYVFLNYDMQRPPEERLFAEGPTPKAIMTKTYEKWTPIIYDLSAKITLGESLTVLDLRHIEFLAHSIKVADLMNLIKSRSHIGPATQQESRHITVNQHDIDNLPPSNWDIELGIERNQAGAQAFVQKMNGLQRTAKPIDAQFARDDFGYVFERQSPHWYHVTRTIANVYDRYKAPVIIYNSGGNHACLVLKIYQEGENWKMVYWNPWASGEKVKDLTNTQEVPINIKTMTKDEFEVLVHGTTNVDYVNFRNDNYLYSGGDVLEDIYSGGATWYDFTLEGDRELADPLIAAKNAQLQPDTDAQNCVLNSIWNFMVRARAKWPEKDRPPEMNEFFRFGSWKFMDDAGVYIDSREDLLKRQGSS